MADQLITLEDRTGGNLQNQVDNRAPIAFMPSPMAATHVKPLDLAEVRDRLTQNSGPEYWRSLQELAETPGFSAMVEREFPNQAPASWAALNRRDFMKLMGAALALAGLSGCARQPQEEIVAYVDQPENMVQGKPLFYATAFPMGGYATGVLAESNQGRPTKIEGNPQHPTSFGRTDLWMQASVLNLWDPDRSQNVVHNGDASTWDEFAGAMQSVLQKLSVTGGDGFRILTGAFSSPTLADQMASLLKALPNARHHVWESVSQDNVHAGTSLSFGRPLQPVYHLAKADVIVGLDADFLLEDPNHLPYARDFISGRRVSGGKKTMNRFYAFESTPTITGAKADHRLPVRAGEVESIARSLASQLNVPGFSGQGLPAGSENDMAAKLLTAIVTELQGARGRSLVTAGTHQPPAVHAIAHAINEALGNAGTTVTYIEPAESLPQGATTKLDSLKTLITDIKADRVKTLLILGTNPVYSAPADLNFLDALKAVSLRIYSGAYTDETAEWCQWHVPEASYLESWSDARATDGTISLIQPLIAPLYQAWSHHELISVFQGAQNGQSVPRTGYEIVKGYWQRRQPAGDFEKFWQTALHDGVVPSTQLPVASVRVRPNAVPAPSDAPAANAMEIIFRPDPTIWDGRFANNGWLQECPKPLTKLTWENTAQVSPKTAGDLGVENQDIVELKLEGGAVQAPIWVVPGHPDNSVTVHLGYGREKSGQIGNGIGFNAGLLRTSTGMSFASGVQVTKVGTRTLLASTQVHHNMHGRNLVREASLEEYLKHPDFAKLNYSVGEEGPINAPQAAAKNGKAGESKSGSGIPSFAVEEIKKEEQEKLKRKEEDPIEFPHQKHRDETKWEGGQSGNKDGRKGQEFNEKNEPIKGIEDDQYPSIYPDWQYKGYAWGMAVDINSCIGCNACVVGCVSENNVAIVGKNEVLRGRHMHWLRIDTYYRGDIDNPETSFQPVMCMHCENAPCEPVCPVEATSHSSEGINEMTYNRCVGTRYCQNNCPYKVRRFNFLQYSEQDTPTIMLMHNPDVTVRARGVMEKCTYCVQRVTEARIESDKDNRILKDREVITACQQACPTDAIVFGNINDPTSDVSILKQNQLNYGLLTELNTQPRTTYLAKVQNPNPALKAPDILLGDTPETPWEASR